MKKLTNTLNYKNIVALCMLSFVQTMVWAQDSTGSVTKSVVKTSRTVTEENVWYGEPWVWAIGVAVFLIIIFALVRGNSSSSSGSSNSVTYTEKVTRETDSN